MKSIKEKAIETERNTHPLFESIRESDGKPVSVYDQDDMISMFEQGANYVFDEIEIIFSRAEKYRDGSDHTILYLDIKFLIEQLKK